MSKMITAGCAVRARSIPAGPSGAEMTSKSAPVRISMISSQIRGSSSMINIGRFFMGFPPAYSGGGTLKLCAHPPSTTTSMVREIGGPIDALRSLPVTPTISSSLAIVRELPG